MSYVVCMSYDFGLLDPNPSLFVWIRIRILPSKLYFYNFFTSIDLSSSNTDVNVLQKVISKIFEKELILVDIFSATDEKSRIRIRKSVVLVRGSGFVIKCQGSNYWRIQTQEFKDNLGVFLGQIFWLERPESLDRTWQQGHISTFADRQAQHLIFCCVVDLWSYFKGY